VKKLTLAMALFVASVLVLAACGGGGDDPESASVSTPPPTTVATTIDDLEAPDLEVDEAEGSDAEAESSSQSIFPSLPDADEVPSQPTPDEVPSQPTPDSNPGEFPAQLPELDPDLFAQPEREPADITVIYVDGELQEGQRRYEVSLDESLIVEVTTNQFNQEVHIHGYDLIEVAGPLAPARFEFVADLAGVWEVELEATGELLFELAVS